jgi:hypothetical protein
MGLNKNRHGTYEARKKVPTHLEEAVARVLDNGKPKQIWLKRSLATKDHSEAKRRAGEGTGGSSRGSRYFNTGLTVTLMDLRWDQVDFKAATLHVRRVKQGTPSVHPIAGDELRALRRLQREQELKSPFVFTSERGLPFTTAGFARMVERAGIAAQGASAHAPARLRLCLGEPGTRHEGIASLSRAQKHPAGTDALEDSRERSSTEETKGRYSGRR